MAGQDLLQIRKAHYGPNTSLNYEQPLHIVEGRGSYLYDAEGREYLDCVNNVTHLGHGRKEVANAVFQQLSRLNTNSRYLHSALTTYTQRILKTMPPSLQVLYMGNSGSEVNDLALRIAFTARPGATHVVVIGGAYHGHTGSLIDLSPYKFWAAGGAGRKAHVHVIPCPDPYRGEYLDGRAAALAVLRQASEAGGKVAAFIAESILSCGGQVIMPQGYLQAVYDVMHAAGVVCIADEVQCGFGRVGSAFWGFQTQGVAPDIVTMGKPMGNGYPVAGLVTTRELADAFSNGMEYFNTYGGSTGAAVVALTVLECIQNENLQQHAQQVGEYLQRQILQVQSEYPQIIGDVRGIGLMVGMECVRCPVRKTHAPALAKWIKERCKAHGVLLSTDGPYDNVIKMKPPMVFGVEEVHKLVHTLRFVLEKELTADMSAMLEQREQQVWAQVYQPRMQKYVSNAVELGQFETRHRAPHASLSHSQLNHDRQQASQSHSIPASRSSSKTGHKGQHISPNADVYLSPTSSNSSSRSTVGACEVTSLIQAGQGFLSKL